MKSTKISKKLRYKKLGDKLLGQNKIQVESIDKSSVKKLLILYDERVLYIGDACIRFSMAQLFHSFFPNARIDLHWQNPQYNKVYEALLINNPLFETITNIPWDRIHFSEYDVIVTLCYEEEQLLEMLVRKYGLEIETGTWTTLLISMSKLGLNLTTRTVHTLFPCPPELINHVISYPQEPKLYISEDEENWANSWVREAGVLAHESLLIILDSASNSKKLISEDTLIGLLKFLTDLPDVKILMFDEAAIDKASKYCDLLSQEAFSKLIFATGLGLRKDLSLLAASQTQLIFGPCTGLMHCASGMYSVFKTNGRRSGILPLLVTYTGKYENDATNAQIWWGSAKLVNCLILRQKKLKKEVVLLEMLSEQEKTDTRFLLACEQYLASHLIEFMQKNLFSKLATYRQVQQAEKAQ